MTTNNTSAAPSASSFSSSNDLLVPDGVDDPATGRVLAALSGLAVTPLCVSDILRAIFLYGDVHAARVLSAALRPGHSLSELVESAQIVWDQPLGEPRHPGTPQAFSARAKLALGKFAARMSRPEGPTVAAPICTLLECVLEELTASERAEWHSLDVERALAILSSTSTGPQRRVPRDLFVAQFRESLSETAVSVDDFTEIAGTSAANGSPYESDSVFNGLVDRAARNLFKRTARHLVLTGERGVGLGTFAVELARRAAVGEIKFLRDSHFLRFDCRYVVEEDSRRTLELLLKVVARHADVVACLDGLGTLIRGPRGTSHLRVLLSAVAGVRGRLIGLCAPREFDELLADDPEFGEWFSRVDVPEPERETAIRLVRHYATGLKRSYGVEIDEAAIVSATVLSSNYVLNECLPGKAVRILSQACDNAGYESSERDAPKRSISTEDVIEAVSAVSGVPADTLRGIADKQDYESSLREVVVGQDHAVEEVASELGLIKAGFSDRGKPASVMLFIGQTGTGKTEMAKALARFYSTSKRLRVYTLGNFVESHSVSGIIGVPAGYVGHDQGGRLITDLNADPYCVVLLDEADKAHPDVLQPLLNLFDEGWIRDQRGVQACAERAIFILTANVGHRMIADMAKQGKGIEEMTTRMKEALSQIRHTKSNRPVFSPELLARIKRVVLFQPLDRDAMAGICRRMVSTLQAKWRDNRQKELDVGSSVVERIADEAHRLNESASGREGGRIVRKLLSELVERPIQRAIAESPHEYQRCSLVRLEGPSEVTDEIAGPRAVRVEFVGSIPRPE